VISAGLVVPEYEEKSNLIKKDQHESCN